MINTTNSAVKVEIPIPINEYLGINHISNTKLIRAPPMCRD